MQRLEISQTRGHRVGVPLPPNKALCMVFVFIARRVQRAARSRVCHSVYRHRPGQIVFFFKYSCTLQVTCHRPVTVKKKLVVVSLPNFNSIHRCMFWIFFYCRTRKGITTTCAFFSGVELSTPTQLSSSTIFAW